MLVVGGELLLPALLDLLVRGLAWLRQLHPHPRAKAVPYPLRHDVLVFVVPRFGLVGDLVAGVPDAGEQVPVLVLVTPPAVGLAVLFSQALVGSDDPKDQLSDRGED